MLRRKQIDHKESILNCTLASARSMTVALGLLSDKIPEQTLSEIKIHDKYYRLAKKNLTNEYACLYLIYLNEEIIGTSILTKLCSKLYHMSGFYIAKNHRRNAANYPLEESANKNNNKTPSKYLLKCILEDLLKCGYQMTLEVMNNNLGACKLYEQNFVIDEQSNKSVGMQHMSKSDIASYAEFRRKKIRQWHQIDSNSENNLAVHWTNVPYYGNCTKWSINRVYLLRPQHEDFILSNGGHHEKQTLQTIAYIIISGNWIKYLAYKALNKLL